jgi:hypothetical protein
VVPFVKAIGAEVAFEDTSGIVVPFFKAVGDEVVDGGVGGLV